MKHVTFYMEPPPTHKNIKYWFYVV